MNNDTPHSLNTRGQLLPWDDQRFLYKGHLRWSLECLTPIEIAIQEAAANDRR